jgi:hypothetical protein
LSEAIRVRVSQVRDSHLNLGYGWVFDIRCDEELMLYYLDCFAGIGERGFADFIGSRDWKGAGAPHVSTAYGSILEMRVRAEREKEKPGRLIDIVGSLNEQVYQGMSRCVQAAGLFIQGSGGYFARHNGIKILRSRYVDGWYFPTTEVKNIKVCAPWPGGKHFMATVGNTTVSHEGRSKWNTRQAAFKAAKRWLAERKVRECRRIA